MRKSLVISVSLFAIAATFTCYINKKVKEVPGQKILITQTSKLDDVPMLEGVGQIGSNYHFRGWGHCRLEKGGTLSVQKVKHTHLDVYYFREARTPDAIDPECINKAIYSISIEQFKKLQRENR